VAVPAAFKETANTKNWKTAEPRDSDDRGEWWRVFRDSRLNQLETQLNASNQTIVNAEANYRQALALVDEARANLFPVGSVAASLTRQKQGADTMVAGSTLTNGRTNGINAGIATTHTLSFTSSWEPDLWGSVRRTIEASTAAAAANKALLASTRLSAQASLAQLYFQVRALDKDQRLLDQMVKENQRALALTRHQYAAGVAARSDVVQAQSVLEAAQAQAVNNKISRVQFEHAIAVLTGRPPAQFLLPPAPLAAVPPRIPAGVPSALLERRPDIAQAERLMAQANAQIGVTMTAYFPVLTLSATGSVTNPGYANWFSLPALGWAIGPQLGGILFEGGLREATLRAARANYDATVASYRQTVLAAFQDIEDNLASLRILETEALAQNKAAHSARQALKLTLNQYQAGTVPYSSVIVAQVNAYTAEKNAADVAGLRMVSAVGLVKALGGGW
jgi:NodT family efflux transporter outer membrane factor (OMF) lipoprotein